MITHDPMIGSHIKDEIAKALAIAQESGQVVGMRFNGVGLTIAKTDTVERVILDYARASDQQHREWEASPEGKASKAEALARAEKARADVAAAMKIMPTGENYRTELEAWRQWVIAISGPSDHVKSGYDCKLVADALRHAGVRPSQYCGDEYTPDCKLDWVLGQVLAMADAGMPPRPLLKDFASGQR